MEPKQRDPNVIREFKSRKARQRTVAVLVLLVFTAILGPMLIVRARVGEIRPSVAGVLVGGLVVVSVAWFIFHWSNWRCPSCNRFLGTKFRGRFCPNCGAQLQ
jgi:hypothetical protein